ncbi:hypothetical protein ACIA5E_08660 [Nocardia asteroides]|uniref:hypothetical protein n=1 Tax=Nocardia asteroides TaxID=1824 RepID=UPI0037892E4F
MDSADDIDELVRSAGLPVGRPVVVVVGGAAGLRVDHASPLMTLLVGQVVPLVERLGAVVVDGGTDAGVMRMLGDARRLAEATFPLVGVAAAGTVQLSDSAPTGDAARIEPGHTDLILVPGSVWGDESPWLAAVATAIARGAGSVTLLVNGGAIAYEDVRHGLATGRPTVVLAGSGRTADEIAAADPGNARAVEIASSPLTTIVSIDEPTAVAAAIQDGLRRSVTG